MIRCDGPSPRQNRACPLKSDPCIYVFDKDTGFVLLTLYVDDVHILGGNEPLLNRLKKQLVDRFEMTDKATCPGCSART